MRTVLFTQKNSIYINLGCDVYDAVRDARSYNGKNAVITHPPCRLFSRMRKLSTAPKSEIELAHFAIKVVRANGGILEHPASSTLFKSELPMPNIIDEFGGYTIKINQHEFGHKCEKSTFLYIVGIDKKDLPPMPLNFDAITHTVSTSSRGKTKTHGKIEISKKGRSATPVKLARWLLEVCELIDLNKLKV